MVLSSSLRHFGELQLHDDRLGVLVDVAVRVLIAPPVRGSGTAVCGHNRSRMPSLASMSAPSHSSHAS